MPTETLYPSKRSLGYTRRLTVLVRTRDVLIDFKEEERDYR